MQQAKNKISLNAILSKGLEIFAVVLIFLFILSTPVLIYQRYNSTGPYRKDYEGKVKDKYVIHRDSELGSGLERYLLIESEDGERFQIAVTRDDYEKAKIGLWVKHRRD